MLVAPNFTLLLIHFLKSYQTSVPVVLVGNKTDLHQERAVSYEEGKKLAESWRATFLETSAKQNEVSHISYHRRTPIFINVFLNFNGSFSLLLIFSTQL